jgi:hypothetical protein
MRGGPLSPEKLVDRLARRLRRHGLWDLLVISVPPLLALSYGAIFLFYSGLISLDVLLFSEAAGFGLALAVILRRVETVPARLAARLIDDKVAGKDRFVTLATIDSSLSPPSLLARLRDQAAGLHHRVNLRRDFAYRFKWASLGSLICSLAVVLLLHLLFQANLYSLSHPSPLKELAVLAERLSEQPGFSELAQSLKALADRLEQQTLSTEERLSVIREMLGKVKDQLGAEKQGEKKGNDLLNQALASLQGLEEKAKEEQNEGGGGLTTNRSGEREGEGKEKMAAGEGGEGEGKLAVVGSKEPKGGKPAQGEMQKTDQARGKNDSGTGDRLRKEDAKGKGKEGKAEGKKEEKSGTSKSQDIPRGKAPERFLKPGEQGERGIKGARFVVVEIPEVATPSSATGKAGSKKGRLSPKIPISNVPLPPSAGPEVPGEKQMIPFEYRGLIR